MPKKKKEKDKQEDNVKISSPKKFMKEIVSIVVGKSGEDLVEVLDEKKHVNEFLIAKKLELTINQVRNLLYKISDYGLVSFIRKKDKRKGWYTYFWKIEKLKALEFLKEILENKIQKFEEMLGNRESKRFYICERCSLEFNEEEALLKDFTCDECGGIFTLRDNAKIIRDLKKQINSLKNELELVNEELDEENKKVEKKKERARKKIEKEKKAKRAKKLKQSRKKLSKSKKKIVKKNSKKKTVKKSTSKKRSGKKTSQKNKKKSKKKK